VRVIEPIEGISAEHHSPMPVRSHWLTPEVMVIAGQLDFGRHLGKEPTSHDALQQLLVRRAPLPALGGSKVDARPGTVVLVIAAGPISGRECRLRQSTDASGCHRALDRAGVKT
jgi:hypothetical protein